MNTCFHQNQAILEEAQKVAEVAAFKKIKEANKKVDSKEQDCKF
jgi:hypothetical protein